MGSPARRPAIKLSDRWSVRSDQYQWILEQHMMSPGGFSPSTGEYHAPRPVTYKTYHGKLRQAILAAIDIEAGFCPDVNALEELTRRWEAVADNIAELLT